MHAVLWRIRLGSVLLNEADMPPVVAVAVIPGNSYTMWCILHVMQMGSV